jgi:hypothetical protein
MTATEINNGIEYVRRTIKKYVHPCYETTSEDELYCGCPECGSPRPKFYIHMAPPFFCHCFLCDYSGVLSPEIVEELGIRDPHINDIIAELNANQNNSIKKAYTPRMTRYKRTINEKINGYSKHNLDYFNKRFNSDISLEELNSKFRGICDVPKFLYDQGDSISDSAKHLAPLDGFSLEQSIGFLSADGTYLICRNTAENDSKIRYRNIRLERSDDVSASKSYQISGQLDIMTEQPKLVMTEGIFDIIGIYLAKYKGTPEEENTIFAAGCGKSYEELMRKYMKKGFLDMDVAIYSDTDVDIEFFKKMRATNPIVSKFPMTVYYNKLSKDVGVPKEQIDLSSYHF